MTGKFLRLTTAFIVSLLIFSATAFSLDIKLTVKAEPKRVPLNEAVLLTISASGSDSQRAGIPTLEDNDAFVADYAGQNTKVSLYNNQMTSIIAWNYRLWPKRPGTFTVGKASIRVAGQTMKTTGVKIEVVGAQSNAQPRNRQAPGTNNQSKNQQQQDLSRGNGIFIRSFVDNETPYVGQQVTHSFELYSGISLLDDGEYSPPTTTGFWSVKLPQVQGENKIINGNIYRYNAVKTALFPTTAGELTIGESRYSYVAGSLFSSLRRRMLIANPIQLSVRPLPQKGKPESFSGVVGDYTISASPNTRKLAVGDVVTIKVTVAGIGNLDLITDIIKPDFSAFRTYDPKVAESLGNSGFVVGGAKSWDFVISPKKEGEITISPFALSFFDPKKEEYRTVSTDPITLSVSPGSATESSQDPIASQRGIENLASDIRFIKADKLALENSSRTIYGNHLFYLLYILPTIAFAASIVLKRRRDMIERDSGLKRRLYAWKTAEKHLKNAEAHLAAEETEQFCGELSEAAIGFISDTFNIERASLTLGGLPVILSSHGISQDISEKLGKNLELCDFIRFSSNYQGENVQQALLEEIRDTLKTINGMRKEG